MNHPPPATSVVAPPPSWEELSALRWGPGLADEEPSIVIPPDWRWDLAHWPRERWVRWRRYVGEFLASLDSPPTADDIRAASSAANGLLRAEEVAEGDAGPTPPADHLDISQSL